ncbi:MAG: hypothetical protein IJ958_02760 [Agathobacter sp.]|nr:hypothetical protein [Agathobacter sp.]
MDKRKSLVVTSNNLIRGLIPTDGLFDIEDFWGNVTKGIFAADEKTISINFYNWDFEKRETRLFVSVTDCTVDERFIYAGNAGMLWFKINFPLSYVRNIKGQNLYAGGKAGIKKTLKEYTKSKILEEDVIPYELFVISRNREDNGSYIDIYPQYQFTKRNYRILSEAYKNLLIDYYTQNYSLLARTIIRNENKYICLNSEENWITNQDNRDILPKGGWYILKNSIPREEYYFGKAENMSNRIKWQKSENEQKIGHPQNNPNKVEPLFDYYKAWYFNFDIISSLISNVDEGKMEFHDVYSELLKIISSIIGQIVMSVLGDKISFEWKDLEAAVESYNNVPSSLDDFFDDFLWMMSSTKVKDGEEIQDNGQVHYVFNKLSSSWISNAQIEKFPNMGGILITKGLDNRYLFYCSTNLRSLENQIGKDGFSRFICMDFEQMEGDIKNKNMNNIWVGFLYGVEGVVNDILRFVFRDLNIKHLNDAFDTASNVAFNNMVDASIIL